MVGIGATDVNLVFIQFQEINSVLTAWGTDGIGHLPAISVSLG